MAPDGTPPTLDGRLEKWRAAEQSATEGPWEAHSHAAGPCCDIRVHDIWQDEQDAYIAQDCLTEADAGFIVEARTAMPLLLGAVERLLELAGEWDADAAELDRDAASARKSPYAGDHAQGRTDEALAGELRDCSGALREAITSALAGKEGGDGMEDRPGS